MWLPQASQRRRFDRAAASPAAERTPCWDLRVLPTAMWRQRRVAPRREAAAPVWPREAEVRPLSWQLMAKQQARPSPAARQPSSRAPRWPVGQLPAYQAASSLRFCASSFPVPPWPWLRARLLRLPCAPRAPWRHARWLPSPPLPSAPSGRLSRPRPSRSAACSRASRRWRLFLARTGGRDWPRARRHWPRLAGRHRGAPWRCWPVRRRRTSRSRPGGQRWTRQAGRASGRCSSCPAVCASPPVLARKSRPPRYLPEVESKIDPSVVAAYLEDWNRQPGMLHTRYGTGTLKISQETPQSQ